MEPPPSPTTSPPLSGTPVGHLSNGGVQRYLLEAESSTGFVAFRTDDGTTLISNATQVSLASSPSLSFWSCASYTDPTPTGEILSFDCHGNSLTFLDVRALTNLEYLDCSFNRLATLPLCGLAELQALDADNNQLTSLEVRHLHALRVLNCANNRLNKLDISGLQSLQILDCSGNWITSLKRDGCNALQDCKIGEGVQ